ncbi:MAG: heme biosynthesis protein HemY [Alphaproteobacteria bacterium]|nr:heme biosynthesis protein HemY [Alphaproteobacteria bacterium]NNF24171.1 heme biosynthesis protein HemY [Paracoccaceae bacterium]
MLWSLIKIVLFIAVIAGLTLGAGQLMETGGGVRIAVGDDEFNLQPLQAVVAVVVVLALFWLFLKVLAFGFAVLRFLNGDETAISRWFDRNRERRGFEALADGMMALASGEARVAMTKAAKAERYLKRPELTNLITAQAAEMAGDRRKAKEVYKTLLSDDRTRFVGVRGLMKQKLAEGDTDTAMKLAEKAFALKPRHEETQDVLLRLQADKGDWSGARKTLGAKLKHGSLPRAVYRRRDAVLALGEARDVIAEGKSIEAREAAIEANRLSPDLIPAAVMAARTYVEQGKPKYASRVLRKTWNAEPHPDIAAAFAEIAPDETPQERISRFTALTKVHSTHPETRMLLAELQIAAEDYGKARDAMGDLATGQPTARSLTIMAAIERGEGSPDSVIKGYLAKALSASRGPQWVCDNCQTVPGAWTPVCPECHAFDTLSWREVKSQVSEAQQGAGMLPLIVGEDEIAEADAAALDAIKLPPALDVSDVSEVPEKPEEQPEPEDAQEAKAGDETRDPASLARQVEEIK